MAKRVNKPFVIVLSAFVFLSACAVVALPSLRARLWVRPQGEMVKEQEELARKYVSEGRYGEAKEAITAACLMDKSNKDLLLERGDILMLLIDEDQAVAQARASWENALGIDPRYKPALNRLMDSYIELLDQAPSPPACERLGSTAARILKSDPGDQRAKAYQQIAVIEDWVLGQSKTPDEIKATFARLLELLNQEPSNAEVMFYFVRGKVFSASEAYQQARFDKAQADLQEARALLDKSTRAFPDNVPVSFRAFQGYVAIAGVEQDADRLTDAMMERNNNGPVDLVHGLSLRLFHLAPAAAARDLAAADAVLRHARQIVKEQKIEDGPVLIGLERDRQRESAKTIDDRYADFQFAAAEWERRNGRVEEAEKILRDYYNTHKTDQVARLELSHILALARDPTNPAAAAGNDARRDEAIQILELPVLRTGRSGNRQNNLKELESKTLLDLTSLRVSLYPTIEASKRPELLKKIDDGYNRLRAIAQVDAIPVLRLKGLIEELKEQNVDAVETLSRAMALLKTSEPRNPIKYDLMYQLAVVQRKAGQNRSAEQNLEELVEHFKDFVPARLQLAELYLEERDPARAERHVNILDKLLPDSQDVLRLKVNLARAQERTDDVKVFYSRLAEVTFADKLIKAQVAATQKDYDETIRLLKEMEQMKPDQTSIAVAVYQGYVRKAVQAVKDGKDGVAERRVARDYLEAELRKHPDDPRLLLVKREGEHPTPVQPDRIRLELLSANGNPLYVEIEAGFIALAQQKYAEAITHAHNADRIRPDDPATWDLYFQIYKEQQNWDLTSEAARKLAELNADNANGRMYRWTLDMIRGNFSGAIRTARDLTLDRGTFGQSWVLLAAALQANGEYHEAIQYYEDALTRQDTNIEVYKGEAVCWKDLGQNDRAREVILRGMRLFPDDPSLRELEIALDTDPVKVVAERRRLLKDNPEDPENYLNLARACHQAQEHIVGKFPDQAARFKADALDTLTRGAGKFPDDLRINDGLALELLVSAERLADGVKVLEALQTTPRWKDKPDPQILLAEYYTLAKKLDLAEAAYKAAWATTQNLSVDIELRLAGFYFKYHKLDQALELLKANASDPRVVQEVLQIHIAANHTEQAIKGLDVALKADPDNTKLLNLKAGVLIDNVDYVQARSVLAHVLSIDPRNDVGMFFRGMVELRDPITSDLDQALNDLRMVATRNPRNIEFNMLYVDALVRVNQLELACDQLESAVKIEPLNREIRIKLLDMQIRLKKWPQFKDTVETAELNPQLNGDPIWYRSHAFGLAAQQRYPEALAQMAMAKSLAPANNSYKRDYLIILCSYNHWGEVIKETDDLMNHGQRDWWVYHLRGLARFGLKNSTLAMEEFDHAMKAANEIKTPEVAQSAWQQVLESVAEVDVDKALEHVAGRMTTSDHWRLQSVNLHMRKHDFAAAAQDLAPLIPRRNQLRRDDRVSTVRFAAECYQALGQARQAEDFYSEWLKESPNDPVALNNYACLLADSPGRLEKARHYSQMAFDAGRKYNNADPLIEDTHGWILSQLPGQDADEGLDILRRLVDAHKDMVDARYHLGLALLIQHRSSEGIAELTTTLDQIKKKEVETKQPFRSDLKEKAQAALDKAKKTAGVQ